MPYNPSQEDTYYENQSPQTYFQYVVNRLDRLVQLQPVRLYYYMDQIRKKISEMSDTMKESNKNWIQEVAKSKEFVRSRLMSTFRDLLQWNFPRSIK
jgi:hypothetical protein